MLTMLLTLLSKFFSKFLLKPITFPNGFKIKVNETEHPSEKLLNIACLEVHSNQFV